MRRRPKDPSSSYMLSWPRWKAYQYAADGWIYPASVGPSWYDPTQESCLPTELARIATAYRDARRQSWKALPTEGKDDDTLPMYTSTDDAIKEAIIAFIQQFGFLGQTMLQEKLEVRFVELEGSRRLVPGDDYMWVFYHACHVYNCLQLAEALSPGENSGRSKRGRQALQYIEKQRAAYFPGLPLQIPTLELTPQVVDLSTLYEPNDSESVKAKAVLRAYLEPNLCGVERGYDPETGRSVFKFKALIQLIYWQVADWINGERLRQCEECQEYFFASDDRQRFCPPPQAANGSRCGRRARKRRANHEGMISPFMQPGRR